MKVDSIISTIDQIHKNMNTALELKDVKTYISALYESFKLTLAEGKILDKEEYSADLEKQFKGIKEFRTTQYRIKSSFENEIFTERIARKSVITKSNYIIFSKKETIQTEENFHWKNINGEWKVLAIELLLEEKY
ncbi:nuclear transport factor 2 family protein [Pedobacter mucosus]|uniref:nuclear transport factor 2 family protein n=1 Tax=Pedobacter mucosus TaxID=2895286 RepID=UPI001EE4030D|nr:nuclear transport factor 2 family protein [Pedobacter mucosus]UKT63620.1 nuclear transport factor 2 family protein [Pedobacter mucosus]